MISLKNVNFAYNGAPVLHQIGCTIPRGEFVGVIGPNGAGKSTLLKLLVRILVPQSGEIRLNDAAINSYSRKALARLIAYVQQDFHITYNFTAWEIVLMGRYPHQKTWGFDTPEDNHIARECMKITDCDGLQDRQFSTLSGGEKQGVVLASALAQEPEILLLDEPTAALDLKHQIQIYQILKKLQLEKQLTIVTVTHDINLASQFCDRIIILKNGRMESDGLVAEVLQEEVLRKLYEMDLKVITHPITGLPVILPNYQ